jgi:hypothetical protein
MPFCPDCNEPTSTGGRCAACEAVEAAFTPGGSPIIEPPPTPISFPTLVPRADEPRGRRASWWILIALAALVLAAAYALRAIAG